MWTRRICGALVAATSVALLSACGGGSAPAASASATSSPAGSVVKLTMWGWGTSAPDMVKAWNSTHPDIQVTLTDTGGSVDTTAKLLTASRAGNAPDLAMTAYETIPSMIVGGVAQDITKYVPKDATSDFTKSAWSQTTFDGKIYGIPMDYGPQALLFNKKRFDELGVAVPTTWAQFADAAAQIHQKDPKAYIATFSAGEFDWFAALARQAGAQWWSESNGKWTVGIDSPQSLAVAQYWQNLIDKGLVQVGQLLTPEWNSDINDGTILSWPSALWGSGVIYGVAPQLAGSWEMTAMPQWTPGDPSVAQTGSGVIITTSSKHPKEAAEFAAWINSSQQGNQVQLTQGSYPASLSGEKAAESTKPPLLMPQQTDYYKTASTIASHALDFTWGPDVNVAQSAFQDAMSKAVEGGGTLVDALHSVQKTVVQDMVKSGFTVTNAN